MSEKTHIERMAAWVHGLEYEHIPERVIEKARLQIFSVLAAIHASSRHEIGATITEAVEQWSGDGPCTMAPSGKKVDLLSAVYANAALSVALDFDDYLLFGHTGHSAVCVPLAVAERYKRSFKTAITAQIAANELGGRLGASVSIGPHNGQGWSYIHLLGAAAAAAKTMGLSEEKTAHAMAIALYQPNYPLWPGFMGPDSKATTAATPAVAGVQAATLASKGATGALDIIESRQGFLKNFSYSPAPQFLGGLGKAWVTDTLAYKIYPGCAYIDTTVDAVLMLREQHLEDTGQDLDPDKVSEVLVEATILTVEMDNLARVGGAFDPLNPVSLSFSIPGNVAIALLKGRLGADDVSRKALQENAESVGKLADKVKLVHDWSLTADFIEALDGSIKIGDILREGKASDLVSARLKMRERYESKTALDLGDLRRLWESAPQIKPRIVRGLKNSVEALLERSGEGSPDYDFGERPLHEFTMPFAARVTITLENGRKLTKLQSIPWAGPGHSLDKTREYVLNKYSWQAGRNLTEARVKQLIRIADTIEDKVTVPKLMDLCCNAT